MNFYLRPLMNIKLYTFDNTHFSDTAENIKIPFFLVEDIIELLEFWIVEIEGASE